MGLRDCLPAILTLAAVSGGCLLGTERTNAGDGGPVIVVPGRPDVPVIINGRDVSWAVVYGDWGLKRPGAGNIIIVGGGAVSPVAWPGGYFPATGNPPAYGRKESDPGKARPVTPAPTYYRSWSIESAPGPVTEYPPFDPPTVILSPKRNAQKHSP